MFYDVFLRLCASKNVSPSKAAEAVGLNRAAVAKWKNGATPSAVTAIKLADYFGVTTDYLLGKPDQKENPPVLTKKDERDIEKILAAARSQLENQEGLMFDGDPASPEAIESILAAMELGLQAAKQRNKEKYTPKKYRQK